MVFDFKMLNILWTDSVLAFLIFPTRISSINGRKTTKRKLTLVCEAPSPGKMYESSLLVISHNAMQRPTFRTTCYNILFYKNSPQIIKGDYFILPCWHTSDLILLRSLDTDSSEIFQQVHVQFF